MGRVRWERHGALLLVTSEQQVLPPRPIPTGIRRRGLQCPPVRPPVGSGTSGLQPGMVDRRLPTPGAKTSNPAGGGTVTRV